MMVRMLVAQSTLDAFRDQPFVWGQTDCLTLASHSARLLGYRLATATGGSYSSQIGATKALKRAGYKTLGEGLEDAGLTPIAYAYALPGDIVALPSLVKMDALGVVVAPRLILAFDAATDLCRLARPEASDILATWAAPPQPGADGLTFAEAC